MDIIQPNPDKADIDPRVDGGRERRIEGGGGTGRGREEGLGRGIGRE